MLNLSRRNCFRHQVLQHLHESVCLCLKHRLVSFYPVFHQLLLHLLILCMLLRCHVRLLRYLLLVLILLVLRLVLHHHRRLIQLLLGRLALLVDRSRFWLTWKGWVINVANFVSIFYDRSFFAVCSDTNLGLEKLSAFRLVVKRILGIVIFVLATWGSMFGIFDWCLGEGQCFLFNFEIVLCLLLNQVLLVLTLSNLAKESLSLLFNNCDLMSFIFFIVAKSPKKPSNLLTGLIIFRLLFHSFF